MAMAMIQSGITCIWPVKIAQKTINFSSFQNTNQIWAEFLKTSNSTNLRLNFNNFNYLNLFFSYEINDQKVFGIRFTFNILGKNYI